MIAPPPPIQGRLPTTYALYNDLSTKAPRHVCPWLLSMCTHYLDTEDSSPIVSKLILVQDHFIIEEYLLLLLELLIINPITSLSYLQ